MNTATHLGREQVVQGSTRTYRLGRWDRSVWWEFLEWARTKLPDPLDGASKMIDTITEQQADLEARMAKAGKDDKAFYQRRIELLSKSADRVLSAALDKRAKYLSINSPEVQSLMSSLEGATYIVMLLMRKGDSPDATEEDAWGLVQDCSPEELGKILTAAAGEVPPADPKNASAPVA